MRSHPSLPAAWQQLRTKQIRSRGRAARRRVLIAALPPLDPIASAKAGGLRYVSDGRLAGIRRIGRKRRVRYLDSSGRTIRTAAELLRIRALAIPPAWTEVWICPLSNGHLQATGRDARGRKQYRYHAKWREVRDEVKYTRLLAFARALPRIRARAAADTKRAGLPREKVLAAVVQLLEKTLIRVGNEEYARANRSFGLTTMRDHHAKIVQSTIRFTFRGKSGIEHTVDLQDARLARIVRACRDLPGYELFQYVDDHGARQVIDSADVNAYVREISGEDFTAKDFRTWAGTVAAATALADLQRCTSQAQAKRNIVRAIETVAKRLGNTKAVCRKSYIHPAVLDAYLEGVVICTTKPRTAGISGKRTRFSDVEAALLRLLEQRLRHTTKAQKLARLAS